MEKKAAILDLIPRQGILPLYFHKDKEVSVEVLRALYTAGIRAVEYTNRGEEALDNFKAMRSVCDSDMKDMYLGAGTIKSAAMAEDFINAGADFIISPGLAPLVAEVSDRSHILWIPGCMTPTEIMQAEVLGAQMVKIFPGNVLGLGFVSAVREIFPGILFMPTGGVELDRENIADWFRAGVSAVGMGSKLISKQLMDARDYAQIAAATSDALAIIASLKTNA
ncbi:MAG: bifunctional 4-hydroxy-2-oxoglutarate aldolase/2-dehydro-3-deoxy-phosphogluconate aldolase [Bacteroidetes bacterium]|nr:bifunctional 4-hydroxy-2-oxoglutarate aldolase/2-dehydro-3-deoxy-phosphogluconate aldolase [Bacteroidota bacterium]